MDPRKDLEEALKVLDNDPGSLEKAYMNLAKAARALVSTPAVREETWSHDLAAAPHEHSKIWLTCVEEGQRVVTLGRTHVFAGRRWWFNQFETSQLSPIAWMAFREPEPASWPPPPSLSKTVDEGVG